MKQKLTCFILCLLLCSAGTYAQAIDPNYADAHYNMGVAHHDLENYNEAIHWYEKAVAIDSNYAWAYANMGLAYANLENYNEAIRNYQKAVVIDPC